MREFPLKLHLDELHVESFRTSTINPSGIESPNYDLGQKEAAGFFSSCMGDCSCADTTVC
jgi:hypothetical protein